jgi:hypothetical protein
MVTKVGKFHFTVDAHLVVGLTRQAYWMENRREWALETLRTYEGISESQIEHILNGTASLENHPDGKRAVYKDSPDTEWQETLAKHLAWIDSRTYLFAGRRVDRELVDNYVDNIVKRLRGLMKNPRLASVMDPLVLMDLERQREDEHEAIFLAAGFTREDLDKRTHPLQWSPEFAAFDDEFSTYLDKKTNWLTGGKEN